MCLAELREHLAETKCIVFGNSQSLANNPESNLFIDYIPIEQVTKVKLLEVKLDNLLSWSDQIDDIVSKVGKGIATENVLLMFYLKLWLMLLGLLRCHI